MPTYEYACPTCGIVECFQSIKDAPLARCPQCKKAKVSRIFSGGGGVIFKGSGFWETDYNRSSDYKKRSAEATAGTPAGGKSDQGEKTDSTKSAAPAATSTAKTGSATAAVDPASSSGKTTKPASQTKS